MNYLARQLAYEEALQVGADDALLLSREGEVLETAHGNIVAKLDQEWVTPAAGTGLLSGTMRQALMEDGELKIREARLGPEELSRAESVFVTNSVRGATEVTRIDTLFEREARGASDLIEAVARTWPAR
jgi:branched-subunit amino acid aminotransferase/4-amino-4-deoxychorismate lyase